MAQDIRIDFSGALTAPALLNANLADGAQSPLTASIDFGEQAPGEVNFRLELDCQSGSVNQASLQVSWSDNNTDFSDTENLDTIYSAKCQASTVVRVVNYFVVKSRYAKFRLDNDSGGAINSANTVFAFVPIAIDQA